MSNPLTGFGSNASAGSGGSNASSKTLSGAHTADLTDIAPAVLFYNSASANPITIPPDADVSWALLDKIIIYIQNVGIPYFAAGTGVTLRNPSFYEGVQYGYLTAQKTGANEWSIGAFETVVSA